MFDTLRRVIEAHEPDAIVTPVQTPVATDSRFFRERGISSYGLLPVALTPDELGTIHGVDERMPVKGLVQGIRIALDTLVAMCGSQAVSPPGFGGTQQTHVESG